MTERTATTAPERRAPPRRVGSGERCSRMAKQCRQPSSELCLRFSYNVRRLRLARGYTQRELAKRCGFVPSYIGNIEQGTENVTLATLETLMHGLGCSEEDLFMRQAKAERGPMIAVAVPDASPASTSERGDGS